MLDFEASISSLLTVMGVAVGMSKDSQVWCSQGQMLGGSTIRISWGRSSTSRASANAAAAAAAAPAAFGGLFPGAVAGSYGSSFGAPGAFTGDFGSATGFGGVAPTATSDPYSAYYSALAQSDAGGLQVI